MVTLRDVAAACGISETQVSRALNDHNDVSVKTKEKVRAAAAALGYVKNMNAQILANRRDTSQIAIIIHGIDEDNNVEPSIIYNIMKGVNRYATENGYEAVVFLNEKRDLSFLDLCRQRGLSGILLFGTNYDDENFKELMASEFPAVAIDIPVEGKNKGSVVINNIYYSMQAVKSMLAAGKRSIAMLSGHGRSIVEVERRTGYEMALNEYGLPLDPALVASADFDLEKADEMTTTLLRDRPDIDGLFCANDFMALGALRALGRMGKQVPGDVAVFGFDGIILGEYSNPTLSTVKQDNVRKGYVAARLLQDIIAGTDEENTVVVPCELVSRASS